MNQATLPTTLPKTMRAARLHGQGFANIRVETVPLPTPNDQQILARVDAAGVCSSILKLLAQGSEHTFINGWDLTKYPIILGDEGCLTIVQAGRAIAAQYPLGKRYAVQPAVDHPPINHRQRYRRQAADMTKVAIGYSLPGLLAEYILITEETLAAQCLVPLPDANLPFFAGALSEPLSCVVSAQDRHIHLSQATPLAPRQPHLGLLPGGICLIIGAGPMGRWHAEAALRFAPSQLIVADILNERLQWIELNLADKARRAGTQLHTTPAADVEALLRRVSQGRGADDIIVAVGAREIQITSQQWLAKGGVLNLFGGLKRGEHILELDALRVHYDEIRICGSSGGSPADVATALSMMASGALNPGRHLDLVGSLDQFPQALKLVQDRAVEGKIVLYPQISSSLLERANNWTRADEENFLAREALARADPPAALSTCNGRQTQP